MRKTIENLKKKAYVNTEPHSILSLVRDKHTLKPGMTICLGVLMIYRH